MNKSNTDNKVSLTQYIHLMILIICKDGNTWNLLSYMNEGKEMFGRLNKKKVHGKPSLREDTLVLGGNT